MNTLGFLGLLADAKAGRSPLRIPVVESGKETGHLEPLTLSHCEDANVAATIRDWRNSQKDHFFDPRPSTLESTTSWLRGIHGDPRRILFSIHAGPIWIGHIGFKGYDGEEAESDALIRGGLGGGPRFILRAMCAEVAWLMREGGIRRLRSRILGTDNRSALRLGDAMAFRKEGETPVKRDSSGRWAPCDPTEREQAIVELVLDREPFLSRFESGAF